jgi:hypothetical protein
VEGEVAECSVHLQVDADKCRWMRKAPAPQKHPGCKIRTSEGVRYKTKRVHLKVDATSGRWSSS